MKYFISLLLFLTCVNLLTGQKESDNWLFGCFSGITFSNGNPTLLNSDLQTREGVATYSDSDGKLVLATDGINVYNGNNKLVLTGLKGDPSSTSSAIIIPNTTLSTNYWIFTVDIGFGSNGVNVYNYNSATESLVGTEQLLISSQTDVNHTEKIAATRKCGNTGYWVSTITRDGEYYVFSVDSEVQLSGTYASGIDLNSRNSAGYMKFSPGGDYLAVVLGEDPNQTESFRGIVKVHEFDNVNGIITDPTNPDVLNLKENGRTIGMPYGIEFSPSSQYLFVSIILKSDRPLSNSDIHRYDLTAPAPNDSRILVGTVSSSSTNLGALQLGPDMNIYVAMEDGNENTSSCGCFMPHPFLGIITDVEGINGLPAFLENAIDLTSASVFRDQCNRTSSGGVKLGLPTFISGFFEAIVGTESTCPNEDSGIATATPLQECNGPFSFLWSNGFAEDNVFTSTISSLEAGEYSVSIVDRFNYEIIREFTLVENGINCEDCFSPEVIDSCGVCLLASDPLFNSSCTDCLGDLNGIAILDSCGVCLLASDPLFNSSCTDCFGEVDGIAILDSCGVCLLASDPLFNSSCTDCFGEVDGIAILDSCGVCLLASDPLFNSSCTDCLGILNGVAQIDSCGQCYEPSDPNFNNSCAPSSFIYIPNVFSPNGDNVNDLLSIQDSSGSSSIVLYYRIFDRWGNLVYDAGKFQIGNDEKWWDGTFINSPAAEGVYVLQLRIEQLNGQVTNHTTDVLLFR